MHKGKRKKFWEKEYKKAGHFALSEKPSEDLLKFTRWFDREYGHPLLNETSSVLDLGCGNGRNLIYLSEEYRARGLGFETSKEALNHAKEKSKSLPIEYFLRSINDPFSLPDRSQNLVLDMMVSHLLTKEERKLLSEKITCVLKEDGWLFLKTFLRDEDRHAERLLKEHPADEEGSYVHPRIGLVEHVFREEELLEELAPYFLIQKVKKSHGHISASGKALKRRSIAIYAQNNK